MSDLESFTQRVICPNPLDLTVYSDGSRNEERYIAAEYCVYQVSQEITSSKIMFGLIAEIFDAEVIRALEGLRSTCSYMISRNATNVVV